MINNDFEKPMQSFWKQVRKNTANVMRVVKRTPTMMQGPMLFVMPTSTKKGYEKSLLATTSNILSMIDNIFSAEAGKSNRHIHRVDKCENQRIRSHYAYLRRAAFEVILSEAPPCMRRSFIR